MAVETNSISEEVGAAPTSRKKSFFNRKRQRATAFYVFTSPWIIGFLILTLLPLLGGLVLSFTNYDGLNWVPFDSESARNTIKFVGTRNYERFMLDDMAQFSLKRVFVWMGLNTPLWLIISFLLAYLLNQGIKARGFFRTLFYLPSVIPIVGIGVIGSQIFHQRYGLVNQFMEIFIPGFSVNWLVEHAMGSITSVAVWTGIGGGMIIFLAGLQNIPTDLEEAAMIDGANQWQRFWRITIPLMTPLIFYQMIVSIVVALQYFALPLLMSPTAAGSTAGLLATAPQRNVYLFMIHSFLQAFAYQRMGYSLALTWILVIIIGVIAFILFKSSKLWVFYEDEG